MAILSKDEKDFLKQANRRLSNMSKRSANDKNVKNALEYALTDINIFSNKKSNKFEVTIEMSERQKNAMLRSAERLINSPYSSEKETEKLYRRQRNTFAKNYGLSKRQAQNVIDNIFSDDNGKNSQVADAWEKIKTDIKYESIKPHLKDGKLSDVSQNIGAEKFGQLMRLYVEGGFVGEQDFATFISDKDYLQFAQNMTLDELKDFVNNKPWM